MDSSDACVFTTIAILCVVLYGARLAYVWAGTVPRPKHPPSDRPIPDMPQQPDARTTWSPSTENWTTVEIRENGETIVGEERTLADVRRRARRRRGIEVSDSSGVRGQPTSPQPQEDHRRIDL